MVPLLSDIGINVSWDLAVNAASSSGILTLVLFLIAHYAFQALPKRSQQIIFVVATFIGIAFILIRVNGRNSGQQPQLKIAFQRVHVMDKPLAQVFAGNYNASSADEIGIIIVADVRNTGSPSMADCCDLSITIPGVPDKIVPQRLAFPSSINVQGADGKTVVGSYTSADALYDKLAARSLAEGDMVRGVLMYGVPNIDPHTLTTPGAKYELHIKDVTGADSEGDWTWPATVGPDVLGYLPGLANGGAMCPAPSAVSTVSPSTPASGKPN